MHFYMFNPADFNNSARHLSLPERAIYRDLIDMYYHSEQAIDTSDMDRLARRLLCTTPEYRTMLEYVLDEFFVKRGKRHHHHRIDREIKNYKYQNRNADSNGKRNAVTNDVTQGVTPSNDACNVTCNADDTPMTSAERTRKSRQERKLMIESLTNIGVSVEKGIKAADLKHLYATHIDDVTSNVTTDVTKSVTHSNEPCNASNAKNDAITSNHELETSNQLNTLNNNSAAVKEKFDVEFWQPMLTEIQPIVSAEAPAMPPMNQVDFDSHLKKFRNFRIEEKEKGNPVVTEGRCLDMFVDWIKREYIHQQRSKSNAAKSAPDSQTPTVDYSAIGKAPIAGDSDLPHVYHPSHSQPVTSVKRDPEISVMVNGLWKEPLPGMSVAETYEYIEQEHMPGEMQNEVYDRLLNHMQVAV
ncbi:YdaU family protein [uncultured Psychrobacter sp.]|uniref:YdaU family protein n=2 Tax=Psychrobacter TaxID=497 RepID=UPI0030D90FA8